MGLLISEQEEILINEGYFSQVTMGLKIHPHQNIDVTLKKHSYPGYLNFIRKCKKKEDLDYLRRDVYQGKTEFLKIRDRIEKINKLGKCKETEKYYDGINKKFISKGITPSRL